MESIMGGLATIKGFLIPYQVEIKVMQPIILHGDLQKIR